MAKFSHFKIDLNNFPKGSVDYSYKLDKSFFEAIDHEDVRKGDVKVKLTVTKTIDAFEFDFHLVGVVQIPCDRCLDEMDQPINTSNRLVVRLGHEYSEETDELIIIPADDGYINIAWYLYEFIVLAIPLKHVHEPGSCNRETYAKYRKHRVNSLDDNKDELTDDDEDENDDISNQDMTDDISEKTDPRWDELKKLL